MTDRPGRPLRLFFSTGEVSGDIVGAQLAAGILADRPGSLLFGVGGSRMAAAGVTIDVATNHLGTVGITEAISKLPALTRALVEIRRRVRRDRPDAAVLIGNDLFNVILGRWLKRQGVPVISYFPPQVWIWKALSRPFSRSFDAVLASFPDEETVWGATGVPTAFVGHYLKDTLSPATPVGRAAARARFGLPPDAPVVALLPGSRSHEVAPLAPLLLDSARELLAKAPDLRFLLPVAEPIYSEPIRREVSSRGLERAVSIVEGSHEALRASDLVLLASGTASLEAALLGVPMVVVYRVSPFTIGFVRFCIRRGWMDSETMALPNLVLGRGAVPELRQETATVECLVQEASRLLADPEARERMRADLALVQQRLGDGDALRRASARIVLCAEESRDRVRAIAPPAAAEPELAPVREARR